MFNPFVSMANIQLAMLTGWMKLGTDMMSSYQTMLAHQMDLAKAPCFNRWSNIAFRGADWCDHYGKRTRDVDVERV